jgi:hypothetical protein
LNSVDQAAEVGVAHSPDSPLPWTGSDISEGHRRRRDNMGELSPRGVKKPTQSRVQPPPNGCARRVSRRGVHHVEGSFPSSNPELSFASSRVEGAIQSLSVGNMEKQCESSPPDSAASEPAMKSGADSFTNTLRGNSSALNQPPTNEIHGSENDRLPFTHNATTPVPPSALGSSTAGDGKGYFHEHRRSSPRTKWSLTVSRGGKAASVVPVHVEEFSIAVPCEQVTTAKKSDVVHAGGSKKVTTPAAASSINLSKVATNSLFQRRRSRTQSEAPI